MPNFVLIFFKAGLTSSMPGIGEDIEMATQQAQQSELQFMVILLLYLLKKS